MNKITILLIILMVISTGFLSGCNEQIDVKDIESKFIGLWRFGNIDDYIEWNNDNFRTWYNDNLDNMNETEKAYYDELNIVTEMDITIRFYTNSSLRWTTESTFKKSNQSYLTTWEIFELQGDKICLEGINVEGKFYYVCYNYEFSNGYNQLKLIPTNETVDVQYPFDLIYNKVT